MSIFVQVVAEALARDYADNEVPISLNRICESRNIRMQTLVPEVDYPFLEETDFAKESTNSLDRVEGFASLTPSGKKYIKVRAEKMSLEHLRFVAAHEIAHHELNHLALGDTLMSLRSDSHQTKTQKRELQADEFARHLLVPCSVLKYYVRELDIIDEIELAKIFCVEKDVMIQRFIETF